MMERVGKKRRLPKDLSEASQIATAHIANSGKVVQACELLVNTTMSELQGMTKTLSTEQITTCLIARHGLKKITQICTVLSGLPGSLNASSRTKYMRELTGMEDADLIGSFIQTHCKELIPIFPNIPTVFAPPVSTCFECNRHLTSNHNCEVGSYFLDYHVYIMLLLSIMPVHNAGYPLHIIWC